MCVCNVAYNSILFLFLFTKSGSHFVSKVVLVAFMVCTLMSAVPLHVIMTVIIQLAKVTTFPLSV